jgi:type II secretory pathway component PulM
MTRNAHEDTSNMPSVIELELDKVPGAWVLTYFHSEDVALRLRVTVTDVEDEEQNIVAEVRLDRTDVQSRSRAVGRPRCNLS